MAGALILSGSPRREGNTDDCAGLVEERLSSAGCRVERIRLAEENIIPCQGCRLCMQTGFCCINGDGFESLWEKVAAADLLVFAAPVYWLGPPGPVKNFIDRTHACYAAEGVSLGNLKAGILSIAAGPGCWQPHEAVMISWLRYYGARTDTVAPMRVLAREKGEALNDPEQRAGIIEWADALAGALA
jgi:multimeric flavodoxin WrbA